MAVVVSIAPYKFLPAKIGGQKGIAFFNQYFGRYVKLICLTVEDNDNSLANGYETIKVFSPSSYRYINPFYFFKIKHILKEKKATHLQIEHPYFGWLGFLLKKATGVKLIVHSHNIESLRFKTIGKWWWKILGQYEKWIHRHADYSFFIHEADRSFAIEQFGLAADKCLVVTYGIEIKECPTKEDILQSKQFIKEKHAIATTDKILLFSGSFKYQPNLDALKAIEEKICPLLDSINFAYKVLICGPWLEPSFSHHPKIIITGFVDSIEPYFKGADIFLNPVNDGGGIKTKLVEALGYNCNAVSTIDGATGINPALCNGKLIVVENNDWHSFTKAIVDLSTFEADILPEYYQHFYWGYSTKKAAEFITAKCITFSK